MGTGFGKYRSRRGYRGRRPSLWARLQLPSKLGTLGTCKDNFLSSTAKPQQAFDVPLVDSGFGVSVPSSNCNSLEFRCVDVVTPPAGSFNGVLRFNLVQEFRGNAAIEWPTMSRNYENGRCHTGREQRECNTAVSMIIEMSKGNADHNAEARNQKSEPPNS